MAPIRRLALIAMLVPALLAPASADAVERTVQVTASATLKVANDTAGLGFSVSLERRTRGTALKSVSDRLRRVITAVQATPGVGAGDVNTGRIAVRKSLRGKVALFRATEGISVTLHQPDEAGALAMAAIQAGATGVSGPNFFVGDTEAAFAKALAAAFEKAKAKASTLATEADAALGPAISISEGEVELPEGASKGQFTGGFFEGCAGRSPNAKQAHTACATPPPTKPGTSTVTATVHVVFALQ